MKRSKRGRREFLKKVPAALVASAVAPVALAEPAAQAPTASAPAAPAGGITVDSLGVAQQIVGVNLPAAEREAVRPLGRRNLANIEAIRQVTVPSELEPAFSFRPPRPRRIPTPTDVGAAAAKVPGPRPANLEDLAFESVAKLGARLRARQVTST